MSTPTDPRPASTSGGKGKGVEREIAPVVMQPEYAPEILFVLGPPCAGKTTLCRAMCAATSDSTLHLSVGDILRSFVSFIKTKADPNEVGATVEGTTSVRISPPDYTSHFSSSELDTIRTNLAASTPLPGSLLAKLLKLHIFSSSSTSASFSNTGTREAPTFRRLLIDNFPRSPAQLSYFLSSISSTPLAGRNLGALFLSVNKDMARKRFEERKREGDEFERRFEEFERSCDEDMDQLRWMGVRTHEIWSTGEAGKTAREVVRMFGWGRMEEEV